MGCGGDATGSRAHALPCSASVFCLKPPWCTLGTEGASGSQGQASGVSERRDRPRTMYRTGQDWTGLDWIGQGWTGLDRAGLG